MLAYVNSAVVNGLEAVPIVVEVDISNGLPSFEVVGLPDTAVKEARERVRAAIKNSGYQFPLQRITVNLAPADIKKEGVVLDAAIALGILKASEQIKGRFLENLLIVGELSLDGNIRPVPGVLSVACMVRDLKTKGKPMNLAVPVENYQEAELVNKADTVPATNLAQLAKSLKDEQNIELLRNINLPLSKQEKPAVHPIVNFSEVKGQYLAKRAMEIAAAGHHNLLMVGSPGSGKTMLARRMAGIMPDLTMEEALDVTRIYSVAGKLKKGQPLITDRPFRAPHHTASSSSLIGGGRNPRPGEISLAHNGILFLDEFPEFKRDVMEALRQPLEEGSVLISRVNAAISYPADILLVAAMNPCPCGYLGDRQKECTCTPQQVLRYRNRLSGPLLDRIDMHIDVPRLEADEIMGEDQYESSEQIKERVEKAVELQRQRYCKRDVARNALMSPQKLSEFCYLNRSAQKLLKEYIEKMNLSARAYNKVLKISRTIADLADADNIEIEHVAEALQFRALDQKYWI